MRDEDVPKIVLLGGGTGSFELLMGLKKLTPHLTAVVNMCDDGGSTGRLRKDYGVMPPGDVRQCLAALANDTEMARLFSYRFASGELNGHAVGNILLAALELETGDFGAAVQKAAALLRCGGTVLPVTAIKHHLVMQDGEQIIRGQEQVRLHRLNHPKEVRLWLEPAAQITPEAAEAIIGADLVVLAPGGLNWTLLPLCLVDGVADALGRTAGQVVCVTDLMNRPEQHQGWHVVDYVRAFQKYLGGEAIDTVLYNTGVIPHEIVQGYTAAGEEAVDTAPERFSELTVRCVGMPVVADNPAVQDPGDRAIARTRIRHDSNKTADALSRILHAKG